MNQQSTTVPAPAADVDTARASRLLSGRNFWQTEDLPEAGVRSLTLSDGPYGLRYQSGAQQDNLALFASDPATCFPPGVAMGASWNPQAAADLGQAIGREAVAQGVDVVLGPGVNIKRSPLCGRNFEYYSEDPLLSGVLGTAFTKALQSEGPGVSVKHFAANNQETNRQTISSDVDERTMREIYLPAFERIVTEAQPATVMSSYNKINGVYSWANHWLLTEVLRDEWGFEGVVVSDWSSVSDRVAALVAGLDLEMPGEEGPIDSVVQAVADGRLDRSVVDTSVARIATLAKRPIPAPSPVDVDAQHDLARRLASECIVLLRNENATLPLVAGQRIAVIGAFATQPRYQGGGSAHVNATRVDIPLDEIRGLAQAVSSDVRFAAGFRLEEEASADESAPSNADLLGEAVGLASDSDVAIVFAGLSETRESEGFDRDTLDLPAEQVELIRLVAAAAPRTVVVLSHGGVVSLEGWHDEVDAIVEGFVLGQGGGRALADVLFGVTNPSGHLAETIPLRLEDHPSWLNFPGEQGHVRYGEGVFVGYRYFATTEAPVRYPFGHGLSYTTFETRNLAVAPGEDSSATVSVEVANTGARGGAHVVQVYVSTQAGPVRRPVRELRGFTKVYVEAGQSVTVDIDLDRRAFAYWDVETHNWVVAGGDYTIEIGADANTVLASQTITLSGDVIAKEVSEDSPLGDWLDHPSIGQKTLEALGFAGVPIPEEQMQMVRSMTMRQFVKISGLPVSQETLDTLMAATRRH